MARHGAPDWSKYRRDAATFSVEDLAEHAARLGSIDVFDRRGDVLFLENFEHGLGAWATGALGAGDSVAISPAWSRSGGYCALLTNGTSGADETTLTTAVHYPQLSLFGFESAVAFDAGLWRLHWDIRHYDGVHFHQFLVRYDYATKLLQVSNAGTYVTLATGLKLVVFGDYLYHDTKLVVDLSSNRYVRFILNDSEYDLSAYSRRELSSTESPHVNVEIRVYGIVTVASHVYVDNVILTQNEP